MLNLSSISHNYLFVLASILLCVYIYILIELSFWRNDRCETLCTMTEPQDSCLSCIKPCVSTLLRVHELLLGVVCVFFLGVIVVHSFNDDGHCKHNSCSLSWMVSTGWERQAGAICFGLIAMFALLAAVHELCVSDRHFFKEEGHWCVKGLQWFTAIVSSASLGIIALGFVLMAICPISDNDEETCNKTHKAGFALATAACLAYICGNIVCILNHNESTLAQRVTAILCGIAIACVATFTAMYFQNQWYESVQDKLHSVKITALIEFVLLVLALVYVSKYSIGKGVSHGNSKYVMLPPVPSKVFNS